MCCFMGKLKEILNDLTDKVRLIFTLLLQILQALECMCSLKRPWNTRYSYLVKILFSNAFSRLLLLRIHWLT